MSFHCDRCSRSFDAALAAAFGFRCPMPGCGALVADAPADPALPDIDPAALPYPLALVLVHLRNRLACPNGPPQLALPLVKDAVEAAVKFLAAVLLAEYRLGPAATRERDEGLIEKLVRPSLGHWVHDVLRAVAGWVGPGPVADLFLAFGRGSPAVTPLFKRLDAFVTFRNEALAHGAGYRPDHVWRRDLADWLPFVGDLLRGAAAALARRPLLLVTDTDRAQVWTGPAPAAATVPGAFTRGLVGRFILGPADRPLPLDPFVCYVPDPDRTNRLHYYDSLAAYRAARKRATVLEYDGGMRHDREEPVAGLEAAFTTELLEKAFGRHRGRMAVIEGRVANFGSLVEAHADIVGRRFVVDAVRRFLAENDRGLLVIEGEPGRGKTALVAHLLEHVFGDFAPRPARFFYRRTASITDPDVCVRSVYHELLATHGITEAAESAARQSPEEVYTKLVNLLADEIAPRLVPHRPQLVFLDALDEADRDAFRRVPEELPAGVYVIATSRPVARRAGLARRPHVHWFDLDSPDHLPDHLADGREYVERELAAADLPADTRDELARVGGGNFLVLALLCRHVRDRLAAADVRPFVARLATAGGPEQLAFIYEEFWQRLTDRCPPEYRQPLCDVAGLLVLAKAPLPAEVMWGVLGLGSAAWDAASGLLTEYLTAVRESEDGAEETFYRLYHESFADFLRAKLAPDRPRLLGRFADYCAAWAELPDGFGRTYALRHGGRHVIESGSIESVAMLVRDGFTYAQADRFDDTFALGESRRLAEVLARADSLYWGDLIQCAGQSCTIAERLSNRPDVLRLLIQRNEWDRVEQLFAAEPAQERRGLLLLAAAALCHSRDSERGNEFRQRARSMICRNLDAPDGRGLYTVAQLRIARVLLGDRDPFKIGHCGSSLLTTPRVERAPTPARRVRKYVPFWIVLLLYVVSSGTYSGRTHLIACESV